MQAKIMKWTKRNSLNLKKEIIIFNNDENPVFKNDFLLEHQIDPAIPYKKPAPLKRVNATFNLMEKVTFNYN